tara:strand:- start:545 stop:1828 length:1284 start_codon:yes stop_codon:yes gene_type:complete
VEALGLAYIVFGLLIGAAVGWLLSRINSESESGDSEQELIRVRAKLEARNEAFENTREQMLDAYKLAAGEAFTSVIEMADKEKESSFKTATDNLSKDIGEYQKALIDLEKGNNDMNIALRERLDSMVDAGIRISDDAKNLTRALKGESQVQGAWGEVVLENTLQRMGFVEGRDYLKQHSETSADGSRKLADFIVKLPNDRHVVLDSKVSLTAYTEFIESEEQEVKRAAMKRHCESIRSHAKKLSSKNYHHLEGVSSLELVLMVPPIDSAFFDAVRFNPSLFSELGSIDKVRVTPSGALDIVLLLIKEMWQKENQTKNQSELIDRAGRLHDKLVLFLESFTSVGFELRQAKEAYELAENRLVEGSGSVIKQTEKLRELGAKTRKDLRGKSGIRSLAERAEEEESFLGESSEEHDRLERTPVQRSSRDA